MRSRDPQNLAVFGLEVLPLLSWRRGFRSCLKNALERFSETTTLQEEEGEVVLLAVEGLLLLLLVVVEGGVVMAEGAGW